MMTEDPWAGLVKGGIDARRVDREGRHDLFWWLSGENQPSLIMRLPPGVKEIDPLPEIRQLAMSFGSVSGSGRALLISLRDPEQKDIFAHLCRDVVTAAEAASDPTEALSRAVVRTKRWHHLLRGGGPDRLSREEQRGLVGELDMLRDLMGRLGAHAAIEAWTGPSGAAKDFELGGLCIEVKARRGASRPWILVSSADQLADVEGAALVLRVVDVDAAVKPQGMTLTDHVRRVDDLFREAPLESYGLWETSLAATGYDDLHDYSGLRWTVGTARHYEVRDGFPRVVPPLVEGVADLRYSISLATCAPFEIGVDRFNLMIDQVQHE